MLPKSQHTCFATLPASCFYSQCLSSFLHPPGEDSHLGAVLSIDGKVFRSHRSTPLDVLQRFKPRRDVQIMVLELLAIALGVSTFGMLLCGRYCIIHSDNAGLEVRPLVPSRLIFVCLSRSHCVKEPPVHTITCDSCISNGFMPRFLLMRGGNATIAVALVPTKRQSPSAL